MLPVICSCMQMPFWNFWQKKKLCVWYFCSCDNRATSLTCYWWYIHACNSHFETFGRKKNCVCNIFVHVIIGRLRWHVTGDIFMHAIVILKILAGKKNCVCNVLFGYLISFHRDVIFGYLFTFNRDVIFGYLISFNRDCRLWPNCQRFCSGITTPTTVATFS